MKEKCAVRRLFYFFRKQQFSGLQRIFLLSIITAASPIFSQVSPAINYPLNSVASIKNPSLAYWLSLGYGICTISTESLLAPGALINVEYYHHVFTARFTAGTSNLSGNHEYDKTME